MTTWKARMRERTVAPKIKIPKQQIAIIKASVEAYVASECNYGTLEEDE